MLSVVSRLLVSCSVLPRGRRRIRPSPKNDNVFKLMTNPIPGVMEWVGHQRLDSHRVCGDSLVAAACHLDTSLCMVRA